MGKNFLDPSVITFEIGTKQMYEAKGTLLDYSKLFTSFNFSDAERHVLDIILYGNLNMLFSKDIPNDVLAMRRGILLAAGLEFMEEILAYSDTVDNTTDRPDKESLKNLINNLITDVSSTLPGRESDDGHSEEWKKYEFFYVTNGASDMISLEGPVDILVFCFVKKVLH